MHRRRKAEDQLATALYRWQHGTILRCFNAMKVGSCDVGDHAWLPLIPVLPQESWLSKRRHKKRQSKVVLADGRVGLRNLGNTCYMNSVTQCLRSVVPSHRPPFEAVGVLKMMRVLAATPHRFGTGCYDLLPLSMLTSLRLCMSSSLLSRLMCMGVKTRRLTSACVGCCSLSCRALHQTLATVFTRMWGGNLRVYSPDCLLKVVWKLFPQFTGFKQQVCKGFFPPHTHHSGPTSRVRTVGCGRVPVCVVRAAA